MKSQSIWIVSLFHPTREFIPPAVGSSNDVFLIPKPSFGLNLEIKLFPKKIIFIFRISR